MEILRFYLALKIRDVESDSNISRWKFKTLYDTFRGRMFSSLWSNEKGRERELLSLKRPSRGRRES